MRAKILTGLTGVPNNEFLLVGSVLHSVGYDREANLFIEAIFDRDYLEAALMSLARLALRPDAEDLMSAQQAAYRIFQRLQRQQTKPV